MVAVLELVNRLTFYIALDGGGFSCGVCGSWLLSLQQQC